MKLAYFSPLNPQPSGISDYSEELLPHLAAHADIELYVDGFRPGNSDLRSNFRVIDYKRNAEVLDRLSDYDAVIYHMGNDHRYHAGIFDAMRRYPGIVVFHDFALQDFFLGLTRERNDLRIYLDELASCHGERERLRAEEYLRGGGVPPHIATPLNYPLNCRLARAADGVIVHSEWSRARLVLVAPGVPVARIPMPVKNLAPELRRPEAKAITNSSGHKINIASFGLIIPGKGIELVLRTLAVLRGDCDFHYTLVGADNAYFDVRAIISALGLTDCVTITGHVPLAEFERRIAETDIAINLRERTVGETSASLCRIMAAGVPVIVSNVGAFAELPDSAVVKIDRDECENALLQAYLLRLMKDARLRRRIGENARRYVQEAHNIDRSAAHYIAFIRDVILRRTRRQLSAAAANALVLLGVRDTDEGLIRAVAAEVAVLAPVKASATSSAQYSDDLARPAPAESDLSGNGGGAMPLRFSSDGPHSDPHSTDGRMPKFEGIDYKRAAIEYLRKLDAERIHYLRTKPFYNLANKPSKHLGDGMDAETHRHLCDFANMAVALALPAGQRLLDVGCGSGWLSEYFARLGYDVTGIDISDDLIVMARERVDRVPYDVDHETPLRCRFVKHDIEEAPLAEKFDAVVCYDSLHHLEDERAVFRHLATMLGTGGLLFILEGHKPASGSATEDELRDVMRRFETLESPFSAEYLRELLNDNGFAVVGDYVSVNGFFEREMLEGDRLPLATLATDYHYLTCMKVATGAPATSVPDSGQPGLLRAHFTLLTPLPESFAPDERLVALLEVKNTGDTLWLTGQTVRAGVVMPGVRVFDERGNLVSEFHGQPMLPRAVAPGQTVALKLEFAVPQTAGTYGFKVDLVDQHVCWFEDRGSEPLTLKFEVRPG